MDNILRKFDLTGKNVLITGAAGLLGIEHAKALLSINANIILTDINLELLQSAQKELNRSNSEADVVIYEMDITNSNSVKNVFNQLRDLSKRVDILINNAAIDPKVKEAKGIAESSRLENFTVEQWNLQISVGLTGAFLCSQIFGNAMSIDGKGGVILNIASDLSVFSPDQRIYRKKGLPEDMQPVKPVTYSVIKSGLIGLTRYLATYWADKGVRSNALSPGGIYTGQNEEFVLKLSNLIPLERMAYKDEYHGAIQFLCSDASAYLNGQNIVMDGGRSVW
jgi:NAD(P)-dependent dehydrogenase (short-subunit alcohol dehydrogenase family)